MKFPPTYRKTKKIEELLRELKQLRDDYQAETRRQQIRALSPRRQELIHTISEHKEASFDFLSRNFRAVPISMLHYNLLQLQKKGYIQKIGSTRGVCYTVRGNL
jgi:predicted HTH transcriptional regulator